MTIKIVTDSTCDLPAEIIEANGIEVVPLYINIGEQGYLDGMDITRTEFYENLAHYPAHPTTGTPGPEQFRQLYERLADEGATQILSIHISISLSATIDAAWAGAGQTKGVSVTVFDSRQLSLGTGFLVETAAKAAADGKSMGEILALLEAQIPRTYVWAGLDTLEFLKRSGRMNGVVAGLGSLLQLKPLLKMYAGQPASEQVRTRGRAMRKLVSLLEEQAPLERVALVHANAPERAEQLRQSVARLLPAGETMSVEITPVIGAHVGPGAVGFAVLRAAKPTEL